MAGMQLAFPSKLVWIWAIAYVGSLGFIHGVASTSRCSSSHYPPTITYYVHALDNSSAHIVEAVNPSSVPTFGQATTFAYPLTKNQDISSTSVGFIRGLENYDSLDPTYVTILVLNTITYDDGKYTGTVSLHGQANINLTSYEIAIVGGTGDFRGVSGYAAVTNFRTPGSDHIFEQVLHFEHC